MMYQWDQFQEVGRRKRFEIYAEIRHFEAYVQFWRLIRSGFDSVQSSLPPDIGKAKTWSEACAIRSSAS